MKQNLILLIVCLMISVISFGQEKKPDKLLREAIYLEEARGELEEALKIYETIVKDFPDEREFAAKAQLHIGMCYEKLGKQQAAEAYNIVIEQFADQQQTAEMAKTRLKIMNVHISPGLGNKFNPKITQIQFEHQDILQPYSYHHIDFSPDGKHFAFFTFYPSENSKSNFRIFLADISGAPVTLLNDPSPFDNEAPPHFSPDGSLIAFGASPVGSRQIDFGISDLRTLETRVVISLPDPRGQGLMWHPSGKSLSYCTSKGIETFNLSGELIQSISMEITRDMRFIGYSFDGKWIAYNTQLNRNEVETRLVSSTGGKNIFLTNAKGIGGYGGAWSQKGNYFYFVSDKGGDQNIYRLKINPETGERNGEPEQITNYYDVDVFNPRYIKEKSSIAYVVGKKQSLILTSDVDNPGNSNTIATGEFPIISPDGNTVYFVGVGKDNKGIFSVPRTGGAKEQLTELVPHFAGYSPSKLLSPDGSTLAFFTNRNENEIQLCFLSANDKKLMRSVVISKKDLSLSNEYNNNITPTWSPDGKYVAFGYETGLFKVPAWNDRIEKIIEIENGSWDPWTIRWSPDGKYIAGLYNDLDGDGLEDVVIISPKNGEMKRLTSELDSYHKEVMEWHPDSKKLTFVYYEGEDSDGIWEAYIDGRPITKMVNQPDVWDYVGDWNPSGTKYYFEGYIPDGLYVYDAKSKNVELFLETEYPCIPRFNKDGNYMVFTKQVFEYQLWLMEGVE